jgi:hypothetical protein
MLFSILGGTLIAIQLLSIIGSASAGNLYFFYNVTNFQSFIYELAYFISFNFLGLLGLFLIIMEQCWKRKDNKKEEVEWTEIRQKVAQTGMSYYEYVYKNMPEETKKLVQKAATSLNSKQKLTELFCNQTITREQFVILCHIYLK